MAKFAIVVFVDAEIGTIMGSSSDSEPPTMELSIYHVLDQIMQEGATSEGYTLTVGGKCTEINSSYHLEA